jgi:hypothetical protein
MLNVTKILKEMWKCTVFSAFFLLKLSQSNPMLGFNNKKAEKCLNKCVRYDQKTFLHKNYLYILNFQNKRVLKIINKFPLQCTECALR